MPRSGLHPWQTQRCGSRHTAIATLDEALKEFDLWQTLTFFLAAGRTGDHIFVPDWEPRGNRQNVRRLFNPRIASSAIRGECIVVTS